MRLSSDNGVAGIGSPFLALADVSKDYGSVKALRTVSFAAPAAAFIVLLGPNGAGKSTLVQLLTGLFVPTGGSIAVLGHDMRRKPVEALRDIGVVFQQPTVDLELSLFANLSLHADLHGIPRDKARELIRESLERFGLADHARRPARTLSGGNRRRLELARALLHRPRVLIMDEATVGLDPASRKDLLKHILHLRDEGILVLWTTHLIDEAEQADRLLFLNEGEIAFDGDRAQALAATGADTLEEAFFAFTRRRLQAL